MPSNSEAVVAVFKRENSIQCEAGSGIRASRLRRELDNLKIAVLDYRKLHDGMVYPAVCGAPTGFIHVFTIANDSLLTAETAGFKRLGKGIK